MADFGPFRETRRRGEVGWVHQDLAGLGLEPFWQALEPLAGAKGRGGVGLLEVGGRELVVRPYRRGGALGSLLDDRYTKPVRARRELEVLHKLQCEGVPVVQPIAAVARRRGAFWRLRLCTERLVDADPAPAFFARYPDRRRASAEVLGVVVRLAFAAGLRHPDLHPDNVLCRPVDGDSGATKVRSVLVDLDRAELRGELSERARDEMLVRMQRYLVRHRRKLDALPSRPETLRFLRGLGPGYGADRAERRSSWLRLAAKLERALALRGGLGRRLDRSRLD
ncbi:MAG: lipopolysaccharide kinase InaA family protein [Planctomycetota bacterium]